MITEITTTKKSDVATYAQAARRELMRDGYKLTERGWTQAGDGGFTVMRASLWHATILPRDDFDRDYEDEGDLFTGLTNLIDSADGRTIVINLYNQPELRFTPTTK